MLRLYKNYKFLRMIIILCFLSVLVLLITEVFLNVKDYNDDWILEGLIPYFLLFTLMYVVLVSFSPSLRATTIITSIFLMVINIIPNLKYVFIYGTYDPLGHYGFIREILKSGHIPQSGVYKDAYGPTPNLHIFLSVLSLLTGLKVSMSMKLFLIIFPSLQPIAVYIVVKRLNLQESLSKLMIISSAIAFPTTYIFTGTSASYILYVFFLYFNILLVSLNTFSRQDLLISTVLGFAIMFSHDATSFFLTLLFVAALLILKFLKFPVFKLFFITLWIVIYLTHFIFFSELNFVHILSLFQKLMSRLIYGEGPVVQEYYGTFFKIGLSDQLKVLMVSLGRDALAILLSIFSLPIMLKLKPKTGRLGKFYCFLVILSFIPVSTFLLSLFGMPLKHRFLYYFLAVSPFMAGITLWYSIYQRLYFIKHLILPITIFVLICISLLQTYPYQPLIPKVSTEYGDWYVVDYRKCNSVFQRAVISFVVDHNRELRIGTDEVTRWQMYGLTDPSYQTLLSWGDPIFRKEVKVPLILITPNARANTAYFGERAAIRWYYLQESLEGNILNIVYNNGESYSLLNATCN